MIGGHVATRWVEIDEGWAVVNRLEVLKDFSLARSRNITGVASKDPNAVVAYIEATADVWQQIIDHPSYGAGAILDGGI